jgi:hypothetical protein
MMILLFCLHSFSCLFLPACLLSFFPSFFLSFLLYFILLCEVSASERRMTYYPHFFSYVPCLPPLSLPSHTSLLPSSLSPSLPPLSLSFPPSSLPLHSLHPVITEMKAVQTIEVAIGTGNSTITINLPANKWNRTDSGAVMRPLYLYLYLYLPFYLLFSLPIVVISLFHSL